MKLNEAQQIKMRLTLNGSLGMPLLLLLVSVGLWLSGSNTWVFLKLHTLMLQLGGPIWANLTMLGDAAVTPLFLVVFIRRRPDLLWAAVIGSLLAYGFSHGLKPLINEARPPAVLDIVVVGPRLLHGSFPSGHATTIFMLAGLLILGLPVRNRLVQLGIVLAAATVGLSRIGVGVHWPVDILIGGADGWLSAACGILLAGYWPWGSHGKKRLVPLALLFLLSIYNLLGSASGYADAEWLTKGISGLALAWGGLEIYLWRQEHQSRTADSQ